ncbi:hypothetical protein RFI_35865, partial [Reticulomyxa filosa]
MYADQKLRGKLSKYRASVAEAYLLEEFDDDTSTSDDEGSKRGKKKGKDKDKAKDKDKGKGKGKKKENGTSQSQHDEDDSSDEDESARTYNDKESNKLIAELQSTIMDLQQQLAEARRYSMQLDMAHQTSVRESKKLKNELSKRGLLSQDMAANSYQRPKPHEQSDVEDALPSVNGGDHYHNDNNNNNNDNNDDDDDEYDESGIVDVYPLPPLYPPSSSSHAPQAINDKPQKT